LPYARRELRELKITALVFPHEQALIRAAPAVLIHA
jgi:hypothetical protein